MNSTQLREISTIIEQVIASGDAATLPEALALVNAELDKQLTSEAAGGSLDILSMGTYAVEWVEDGEDMLSIQVLTRDENNEYSTGTLSRRHGWYFVKDGLQRTKVPASSTWQQKRNAQRIAGTHVQQNGAAQWRLEELTQLDTESTYKSLKREWPFRVLS